jgi:uncharacterized membrane protein YheB (UPF0754 family)
MMFVPVEFVGIKPFLGWQGIVPRHARALAARSTDLITQKLINLQVLFERFDAAGFAAQLDPALDDLTEQVIRETAQRYAAETWASLPEPVKAQVRAVLRREVEQVAIGILDDLGKEVHELLDLKAIVVEAAVRDRKLIGDMFEHIGEAEFRFIKRSGLYFGFLFGILQLVAWVVYPAWWSLPLAGFFVGYATNWMAIKLIFEPAQPRRFGPVTLHGLFHKRQHQVAAEFAKMVSGKILDTRSMVGKMSTGPAGDRLFAIVDRHVGALLDRFRANPMATSLVPADAWGTIRAEVLAQVRTDLTAEGGLLWTFTERSIDVHGELLDKMTALDSESFEGVLRPAFQQDEWKLIVAGAVLGLGAGVVQVVYVFGEMVGG